MESYEPTEVLNAISDHSVPVVLIGGLSIAAMFVYFIEGARMGRRDRVYPMALWMTVLWLPHDGSYLLHFDDWFDGPHDHWFMQLFWFAIIVTFLSECVFFVQTIQYGRSELSPRLRQRTHALLMVGALTAGVISWAIVKGALDDDLYLISFMATLLWGCPSANALLARHPDGKGQSVLERVAFSVMAVMYSITSIGFFGGGFFHSWEYVSLCLAASLWSLVNIYQAHQAGSPRASWVERPIRPEGPGVSSAESAAGIGTVAVTRQGDSR